MDIDKLIEEINKRIEFHKNNLNDPYGISNAVMVALTEIVQSIQAAKKP